jgi:transcription initiation factor TFIID subunit TAF12
LNIPQQNKDIYVTSVLKQNALADICSELTSTETLDINVEKFLADMADNFLDTVLDSACQLAKHKKNDKVSIEDIAIAIEQNFDIYEPNKYTKRLSQIKTNEIKNISTNDHKKRLELTKEETKNVNI